MMKHSLLIGAAGMALIASAAQATPEVNSDVGMDTSAAWMADAGWSLASGKAVATNATKMAMLMGHSGLVLRGHHYHWAFDVVTISSGEVRPVIGLDMAQAVTIPTDLAVNIGGAAPIADNFTTVSGLTTGTAPGDDGSQAGAFRMFCNAAWNGVIDPEVKPGKYGVSHLHTGWGNTGVTANSTGASLRQSGGTSCGNHGSQKTPINRSSYWAPSMLTGTGSEIDPDLYNTYYKQIPDTADACHPDTHPATAIGWCVPLPNNIKFLWGYDFTTNTNPLMDSNSTHWECWPANSGPPVGGHQTAHMKDFFTGGLYDSECHVGDKLFIFSPAPQCWDGNNLDSATHRTHVVVGTGTDFGQGRVCDGAHPYVLPNLQIEAFWTVDANFKAGKWHLSCDEMVPTYKTDPGYCWHIDYIEAWSPAAKATWYVNCIRAKLSCSGGNLGDLTKIRDANTNANLAPTEFGIESVSFTKDRTRYHPTADYGFGRTITAPGHYEGEFTSPASGPFGLMGLDNLNGTFDNLQIHEVPLQSGPATVVH